MNIVLFQIFLLAPIALFVSMPIITIDLNRNLEPRKIKINRISTAFMFLFIRYVQFIKRESCLFFEQRFSIIGTIASKATKLPVGISWQNPKFFIAVFAIDIFGWSAAFFRAIITTISFFVNSKLSAASFAILIFYRDTFTFFTTYSISVLYRSIYPIIFITNWTMLFDFCGFIATLYRAKLLPALDSCRYEIKSFIAIFANKIFPSPFAFWRRIFKCLSVNGHHHNYNTGAL